MMIKAGIYGATGYTGYELVKILSRHPAVHLLFATSNAQAGQTLADIYPAAPSLSLIAPDDAPLAEADIVFLCLPHAAAAAAALDALAAGVRVIDLSADFRLKDADSYAHWYGHQHPAPDLLAEAVYGLTEFARAELPAARLVANPGCYPTSILLALQPLLCAGAVAGPIIADAKSGVSGAGRTLQHHTQFVEVADNFSPYKIGRAHRHLPEIEQQMRFWNPAAPQLIFSPHLLPVPRGILSTIYVPLQNLAGFRKPARFANTEDNLHQLYHDTYGREPFIHLLPAGQLPSLAHVTHTNRCALALTLAGSTLIITSAIDNLLKGAAGQAVQNMNVMLGIEETTGLL
jgi:N-acetyl-gamma-glutamyl-phosphate reductase